MYIVYYVDGLSAFLFFLTDLKLHRLGKKLVNPIFLKFSFVLTACMTACHKSATDHGLNSQAPV